MFTTKLITRTVTIVTMFILALSGAQAAYAAPPANDNFADAEIITSLPFSATVDVTDAGVEPGETQNCQYINRTVWYSFTPADTMVVRADLQASSFPSNLNVYQATGPGISNLNFLSCTIYYGPVTFLADAGQTYYLQAGDIYTSTVGSIQINLAEIPAPANDQFANATIIPSIPFDDTVDTAGAKLETGEPTPSCAFYGTITRSVWYSFTPATSGTVSASIPTASFTPILAAYTGNSLGNLTEKGCQYSSNLLTLSVNAGNTYYFQVGNLYPWEQGGSMQFHLDVPPPPVVQFWFDPFDPSVFDTVQFYNNSYDPANVGFQSFVWDFGDGTTSTADWYAAHKYSADRDYTAKLTVTTFDGRTASTSQVISVKTHDVAITKVSAPKSASSGQTRAITVYIKNNRYGENVQVDLYKSVPGGFQWVGSYTQFVPVRPGNRTTPFTFNYTFTNDDASVGKVTFKAIASIINARDALPADNELISSPPTKVSR